MSKISNLAQKFNEKSKSELAHTEQQFKNDLSKLSQNISAELQQSEQKISADIRAQHLRMRKMIFKPYLWFLSGFFILILILSGTSLYFGKNLEEQWQKYQVTKHKLEQMNKQMQKMNLQLQCNRIDIQNCKGQDGKNILCVAINPNEQMKWGEQNQYRAVLLKP